MGHLLSIHYVPVSGQLRFHNDTHARAFLRLLRGQERINSRLPKPVLQPTHALLVTADCKLSGREIVRNPRRILVIPRGFAHHEYKPKKTLLIFIKIAIEKNVKSYFTGTVQSLDLLPLSALALRIHNYLKYMRPWYFFDLITHIIMISVFFFSFLQFECCCGVFAWLMAPFLLF